MCLDRLVWSDAERWCLLDVFAEQAVALLRGSRDRGSAPMQVPFAPSLSLCLYMYIYYLFIYSCVYIYIYIYVYMYICGGAATRL